MYPSSVIKSWVQFEAAQKQYNYEHFIQSFLLLQFAMDTCVFMLIMFSEIWLLFKIKYWSIWGFFCLIIYWFSFFRWNTKLNITPYLPLS